MKILQQTARIILGITFIFSGFVKGIDPWGSAYKFTDYFTAFGWEPLIKLAFPLGILLAFAEFAIGVALFFKLWMRFTTWLALLFMIFFTGLTFYLALSNPVSDCGCFGDAVVLTNWQTFYKNLVLISLAYFIFRKRKSFENKKGILLRSIIPGGITVMIYFYLVMYSYNHLPVFDFRPYKVGTNIPEAMKIPVDAPKDVYETIFRYKNKKTGKIKTFTESNYPWQDSLHWEYVSMDAPKLIKEGYKPPIHDFMMESETGEDVKDFFLYDEGYTFIMVAYNLKKTNRDVMKKINELARYATANSMHFIGMTASVRDDITDFTTENRAPFDFFNCDEITLKTIIRSNPGLLLLKKGTIIAKWHYNDIPNEKTLKEFIE